jgi:hypothetical protein
MDEIKRLLKESFGLKMNQVIILTNEITFMVGDQRRVPNIPIVK